MDLFINVVGSFIDWFKNRKSRKKEADRIIKKDSVCLYR